MQVEYRALAELGERREDVGSLLLDAFGPSKSRGWAGSYERAMAGGSGWVAVTEDGELAGVAIGERVDLSTESVVHAKLAVHGAPVRPDDIVGTVSYLAVGAAFRGNDIGDELARRVVDDLAELGATLTFALAWQNGAITSDRIFQGLGFRQIEMIGDDENESDPYHNDLGCQACGTSPCTCEAMLYAKRPSPFR